jgi:hypothetical protein
MRRALTIAALILLQLQMGCNQSDKSDQIVLKTYVPPDGAFTIKVPLDPEARMVGLSHRYTFYGLDNKALGPLLTIEVTDLAPQGATGAPLEISLDKYEQAYRAESGAVVDAKPLLLGSSTGRELDITAGQRAPLKIRIYRTGNRQYWLEWNPNIAHSTETADAFVIP